ncbi:ATP-dependent helicase (plasmid) [Malaciobacter mytili LMG 24559]|nr:ATP-dependent helicase [Malaciobacter mytili LMG 24559]
MIIPTQEQINIVHAIKNEERIKIRAFAGAAKTTTLELIANSYKSRKILYLTFNKANEQEAKKRFKDNSNVTVKTIDALAYANIAKYAKKIKIRNIVNYKEIDIAKLYNISFLEAKEVFTIFNNYCNSDKHYIDIDQSKEDYEYSELAQRLYDEMETGVIEPSFAMIKKHFETMLKDDTIGYLDFDILMLDEGQDINPVQISIFNNIPAKRRILVGDDHQQIYSFNNSINAMKRVKGTLFHLTETFRYNKEIAAIANKILQRFKAEENKIVSNIEVIENPEIKTEAYISRTNAELIKKIAELISEENYNFNTLKDPDIIFTFAIELFYFLAKENHLIKKNKKFFSSFNSTSELETYINEIEDNELSTIIKIVKEYGAKIISFYEITKENYDKGQNGLILTNAHICKGFEFDKVIIADDFADFAYIIAKAGYESYQDYIVNINKVPSFYTDEINLFYVAVTRAKQICDLSDSTTYLQVSCDLDVLNFRIKKEYDALQRKRKGLF